jgi:hypothetical protein
VIAKVAPSRKSGHASCVDLRNYLEYGDGETLREDFYVSWSSRVASHATADLEMDAVAARLKTTSRNADTVRSQVLHHVVLSWRPKEMVSEEVARSAVDAMIRSLDAEAHQWYAAMHVDSERVHVHLAINRVEAENYRLLRTWNDHARLARAAEWVEREHGCLSDRRMNWRAKGLAELDLSDLEGFEEREVLPGIAQITNLPPGAATSEADAVRQAGYSWVALLSREAVPAALSTLTSDGSWERFHAAFASYGVRFERAGSGARLVGAEIGQHVKASRLGLKLEDLEARLGPYVAPQEVTPGHDFTALRAALDVLEAGAGWSAASATFEQHGFAFEKHGGGGGSGGKDAGGAWLVSLADGARIPFYLAGLSYGSMRERWGDLSLVDVAFDRELREDERRAEGLRDRAALVAERPEAILDRLSETRSLWSEREIDEEIARLLHLDYQEEAAQQFIAPITALVVDHERTIDLGEGRYSTVEIVEEEHSLHEAAERLMATAVVVDLPAPDTTLDEQQRRAYHALTGERGLALVSGIAGAGKSRLLRDVAVAYTGFGDQRNGKST